MMSIGFVYVVRLSRPMFHARLYLGSTVNLEKRMAQHRSGKGSPLLRTAIERGIQITVICCLRCRSVSVARIIEAKLKRWKSNRKALVWLRNQISPSRDEPFIDPDPPMYLLPLLEAG